MCISGHRHLHKSPSQQANPQCHCSLPKRHRSRCTRSSSRIHSCSSSRAHHNSTPNEPAPASGPETVPDSVPGLASQSASMKAAGWETLSVDPSQRNNALCTPKKGSVHTSENPLSLTSPGKRNTPLHTRRCSIQTLDPTRILSLLSRRSTAPPLCIDGHRRLHKTLSPLQNPLHCCSLLVSARRSRHIRSCCCCTRCWSNRGRHNSTPIDLAQA